MDTTEQIAEKEAMRRKFDWKKALAKVPGKEGSGKRKRFALDSNGVYQVYSDGESYLYLFALTKITKFVFSQKSLRKKRNPFTLFLQLKSTFKISTKCSQ